MATSVCPVPVLEIWSCGEEGGPFACRTLDYQDQYCFLFSFPLGCQKYPGKVSDSCNSLSELDLGLETDGTVRSGGIRWKSHAASGEAMGKGYYIHEAS